MNIQDWSLTRWTLVVLAGAALLWVGVPWLFPAEEVQEVHGFTEVVGIVNAVAFTPDGKYIVCAGHDGVRIWNAADYRQVTQFGKPQSAKDANPDPLEALVILSSKPWLCVGGGLQNLQLWDYQEQKLIRQFGDVDGKVLALALSPDERFLFVGTGHAVTDNLQVPGSYVIQMRDLETGEVVRRFEGHQGPVGGVAVLPDGTRLLSSSDDKTVRLWDVSTGKELRRDGEAHALQRVHEYRGRSVVGDEQNKAPIVISRDGRYSFEGLFQRDIEAWTKQLIGQFYPPSNDKVTRSYAPVALCGDDRLFISRGDGALLWDLKSQQIVRARSSKGPTYPHGVAVSPDGKYALTAAEGLPNGILEFGRGSAAPLRLWKLPPQSPDRPPH